MAALVAAGFGVCIAPASVAALRVRGTVMHRLLPDTKPTALFLCTPAEPRGEPIVSFVKFVLSEMRVHSETDAERKVSKRERERRR